MADASNKIEVTERERNRRQHGAKITSRDREESEAGKKHKFMDVTSADFKDLVALAVRKQLEEIFVNDNLMQEEYESLKEQGDSKQNGRGCAAQDAKTVVKEDGTYSDLRGDGIIYSNPIGNVRSAVSRSGGPLEDGEPSREEGPKKGDYDDKGNERGVSSLVKAQQHYENPSNVELGLGAHILNLLKSNEGGLPLGNEINPGAQRRELVSAEGINEEFMRSSLGAVRGRSGPFRSMTVDGTTVYRMLESDTTEDDLSDVEEKKRRGLRKYFATLDIFGRVKQPETGIRGTLTCNRGTHPTILDGVGDSSQEFWDKLQPTETEDGPLLKTQESTNYDMRKEDGEQSHHSTLETTKQSREDETLNDVVPETQMDITGDIDQEEVIAALTENYELEENEDELNKQMLEICDQQGPVSERNKHDRTVEEEDGGREETAGGKGEKIVQRKSIKQNIKWGDRVIGTKDLIKAAVKAKTPLPACEGTDLSHSISLFDMIGDCVLSHLISSCGVNLGKDPGRKVALIRKWEKERRVARVGSKKLETIQEEIIENDQ